MIDTAPFPTRDDSATLVALLRARAVAQDNRHAYTFLIDGETEEASLTYADLDRRSQAIAAGLQHAGAAGERALLLFPPGLDYIAAFFGCLYAGVVAVPVYPPQPKRPDARLHTILADSGATYAITTAQIQSSLAQRIAQMPDLARLQWIAADTIESAAATAWQQPAIDQRTLAFLQYTSGSTAAPKGVMLTHANLLHNLELIRTRFGHTPESRGLIWLPPYHDMGLIGGILQPLYAGFPVTLMSPLAFLQRPLRWLQAISRTQATTSGGPNFAYDLCVQKIAPEQCAGLDLSAWNVAFTGAEPIQPATLERFARTFEPYGFRWEAFYPCYGLAEATLIVSGGTQAAPPIVQAFDGAALEQHSAVGADDPASARTLVSCGSGAAQAVAIVDPHALTECLPGRIGEIWVASPSVAGGYWQRPDETRATFEAHTADTRRGPFLRTGDLGFIRDGELFVTGRIKDLIIIRGRNHYPQDIEQTVAQSHAAVRQGAGAAFSVEVDGEEWLVIVQEIERRYRKTNLDACIQAIRQAIVAQHELHTYAVVLIEPGSIFKTSSGKIQRQLCRSAFLADTLKIVARDVLEGGNTATVSNDLDWDRLVAAPVADRRALLEEYLHAQVAEMLQLPIAQVERERSLSTLGLDSLRAVQLQHAIETRLGAAVPMERLLEGMTLAQLADELLDRFAQPTQTLPALLPVPRAAAMPLSFDQERLWLLDQLEPGNPAYHVIAAYELVGTLNSAALEQSIDATVQRQEALRITFAVLDGQPRQVIHPDLCVPLTIHDRQTPVEQAAEVERVIADAARQPFDLSRGPLLRAALVRLAEHKHVLIWVAHHIIADLWSMLVLTREVFTHYARLTTERHAPQLADLPVQFVDVAHWQRQSYRGQVLETQRVYWKTRLAGAPPLLDLPTDRPRPQTRSYRVAHQSFILPAPLVEQLRQLARQEGATLFMALLASFKLVLSRHAGQTDIVIGTPVSGRTRPGTADLIGFFAHPLPLRTDLSGDPTYRELLARIRAGTLEAYAHQDLPLADVVEAARIERTPQYNPLFQVMLGVLDTPLDTVALADLTLRPLYPGRDATDFDLFVTLVQAADGLRGIVEYSVDLFDADTIAALIAAYSSIVEQSIARMDLPISQFELPQALAARARQAGPPEQVLAVAATFTAEPVAESLAFWMQQAGVATRIAFASYNQVFQQLLDPSSLLAGNRQGINIVLIRLEDWQRFDADTQSTAPPTADAHHEIERQVQDFVAAMHGFAASSATPQIVCICPASARAATPAWTSFLDRMEAYLVAELSSLRTVHVVTSAEIAKLYPVAAYYDERSDDLGQIPYTRDFFTALGTTIARKVYALRRAPSKVIVLDCDQTLWKGVCAEDGPLGIGLDPPYLALQRWMIEQHAAGMLLCLCSKNSESDVFDVFRLRPEMPLKRELLVAWRINWAAKSENMRSLAAELQLGLDSFIFIDDDAVSCAEMRANCPEVLTLQLPSDAAEIPPFLRHVWAFDHVATTAVDQQRTLLYQQSAEREQFRKTAPSFGDFLVGLGLRITIAPITSDQIARVAQLTQRTNQFNVTTIRRSEGEIQQWCRSDERLGLAVEVQDRFGAYGLVGVMLAAIESDAIEVDTFLLSCRALARGVEYEMLAELGRLAQAHGRSAVVIAYVPTGRNQPAGEFLDAVGSDVKQIVDGGARFTFPASFAAALVYRPDAAAQGTIRDQSERGSQGGASHADRRVAAELIERIARELLDVEQILAAIDAQQRRTRPALESAFVAPRTAVEQTLADIWAEILGLSQVGIHDNFFELGGDSILTILMVSRAAQAGIQLQPRQLLQHPTIAELALIAEVTDVPQIEQRSVSGPVPLTPIQHWFFEQQLPEPQHWNMALLLVARQPLEPERLRQALDSLLLHHDALRLRFTAESDGWQQENVPPNQTVPFERVDLAALSAVEQAAVIETATSAAQASLNLSAGPLVRAVLFDHGPDQPGSLLLVLHHLVVDGVSWRILVADLETAYRQLRAGEAHPEGIRLPAKTTSFKQWSERLAEQQSADLDQAAVQYWLSRPWSQVMPLPVGDPAGSNTEGAAQIVSVALGPETTSNLLQHALRAYNSQINDLLLTALAQTIRQWSGQRTILVDLEAHGRDHGWDDIDLSRTVGWLTTITPLALELAADSSPDSALKQIKEQLRRLPAHGLSYGRLRYGADPAIAERLRSLPQAEISFNYLGQFDQMLAESALFERAVEPDAQRSPHASRRYRIDVLGRISGGRLLLDWKYSAEQYRRTTIERVAQTFIAALQALIAHCLDPEVGGYVPSDFPEAALDQAALNALVGELGRRSRLPPRRVTQAIEDIYTLSPMQQSMLSHALYAPDSRALLLQWSCTLSGSLDRERFQHAWQQVVVLHPALRTSFVWDRHVTPLQIVWRQVELPIAYHDWRDHDPSAQAASLDALLAEDQRRGFDLAQAPLMRVTLIRVGQEQYRLIWSHHHLIMDGWSEALVFEAVMSRYQALVAGHALTPAPARRYRDFIAWLKRQDVEQAQAFWRQTLSGFTAPTPLGIEAGPRSPVSGPTAYAEYEIVCSPETTAALLVFVQQQQLTLNILVQAAWAILLSRYSGSDDIVFGATVAGRAPELPGSAEMIGLFINNLPVRVRLPAAAELRSWLRQLQSQQFELRQYEYTPIEQVQAWSDVTRPLDLFHSMLVFQNIPIELAALEHKAGLSIGDVQHLVRTAHPLTLVVEPGPALTLRLIYDCARFQPADIARALEQLHGLLERMIADPAQRLGELSILTAAEEQQLAAWSAAQAQPPDIATEQALEQMDDLSDEEVLALLNAMLAQGET